MPNKARTPWFPTYSRARQLYHQFVGTPVADYDSMEAAIGAQMGTPQSQVDWSDPDAWIAQRLTGKNRELATRLWAAALNPRYTGGELALARVHGLLRTDTGTFEWTPRGLAFDKGDKKVVREIDEEEGVVQALSVLATLGSAQKRDIVVPWMQALGGDTRSENTMSHKLYDRLVNAVSRGLVERQGIKYVLTAEGQAYAVTVEKKQNSAKPALDAALHTYRDEQRERLRKLLKSMHPFRFEHLIKNLLVEMGYENVEVTKQSGDGGIDVVADLRFGVTTFREGIQVKRVQGNLSPDVVNQLRGSLPAIHALKGTLFTVDGFSKKALEAATAAPPISLVNGEELIDLLMKYRLGITVTSVELVTDIDEGMFSPAPMTDEEKAEA